MRASYHEALTGVSDDLVRMTELVQDAVRTATTALLEADLPAAERVITEDSRLDDLHDCLLYTSPSPRD